MSISIHTGNPRTGKTYAVSKIVRKALRNGETIYSNIKFEWEGEWVRKWNWKLFRFENIWREKELLQYWTKLEDLYDKKSGIIVMDEIHIYLNSRKWAMLPEDFEKKLYQHGKDGLHIIGTVQNIRRLDTIARELIDYWYYYEVIPKPPQNPWKKHKPKIFKQYQILMETDINSKRAVLLKSVYLFRKKQAAFYDTLEKVN